MIMNIPVVIPTKKYIRAYVISKFGDKPLMNTTHLFGSKFYDLLSHKVEDKDYLIRNRPVFNSEMKLYIPYCTFASRGGFISNQNMKIFNAFMEGNIKEHYRFCMDTLIEINPFFEENLKKVREIIGIDVEHWDSDSIKKDYYRYRKTNNLPLLYKSKYTGTRSEQNFNCF